MLKSYFSGLITFLFIDTIWIQSFVTKIYLSHLEDILLIENQQIKARLLPAILFYILFYSCLYYLSVVNTKDIKEAMKSSFFIGLISYGTYSFTNMAVIKQWTWSIAISDLIWGPVLCIITTLVAKKIYGSSSLQK